jgi:hypothetical protein
MLRRDPEKFFFVTANPLKDKSSAGAVNYNCSKGGEIKTNVTWMRKQEAVDSFKASSDLFPSVL